MPVENNSIFLENLQRRSAKKHRYLNQFLLTIPPKLADLKAAFKANDLSRFRKTLHFITPNLIFFGLKGFPQLLEDIEKEADFLSSAPLNKTIEEGMIKIEKEISGVERLIVSMTKNDLNED